jgi:7-carboxy-7-deazaguanine synthase
LNNQPAESRDQRDGLLSVHSIFHTIQGEGPFCGTPSVFIRLAGCNLQCPGCDTDYTSGRFEAGPNTILEFVREMRPSGLVVITGGEPFRQDIERLLYTLMGAGYYVQIETNGTYAPPDVVCCLAPDVRKGVYVVVSPKTGRVHPDIARLACAFKYVVSHDSIDPEDGLPLNVLDNRCRVKVARPPVWWERPVYLQPMDSKDSALNDLNLRAAIASCMKYGHILQLQLHKLIGLE